MADNRSKHDDASPEKKKCLADGVNRLCPSRQRCGAVGDTGTAGSTNIPEDTNTINRSNQAVLPLDDGEFASNKHRILRQDLTELSTRSILLILLSRVLSSWEIFFHTRTDEYGCYLAGILRIAFSILLFLVFGILALDYELFFVPGNPMIPVKLGRQTIDQDTWSMFPYLPETAFCYWTVYGIFMIQIILLGLGVLPRFQIACVFFWIVMIRHIDNIIWDAEDNVMRVIAFFMIFWPLDRVTIWDKFGRTSFTTTKSWPMWPFRLVQIEMCLIYLSTVISKFQGEEWTGGIALWYVVHLKDTYGMWLNPNWIFGYHGPLKVLTYATLVLESTTPIMMWISRRTRLVGLFLVTGFHLSLDLTMNLNAFHWIMIIGWMSFLVQPASNSTKVSSSLKID